MRNLSDISIQFVKGVGPARKKMFANLGVESVEDLLYFFPRRYEDRTHMTPIAQVKVGEYQTICGTVKTGDSRRAWYTQKHLQESEIDDGTGRLFGVWFNQPYLSQYFKPGRQVVLYGKVDVYKNRLQMVAPEYEFIEVAPKRESPKSGLEDTNLNTGRIVPVYPLTRGMTQRYLRKVVAACLERYRDDLADILPVALRNKYRLVNLKRSISNIHFPESLQLQQDAHYRISFEEFFLFQLSVIRRRMSLVAKPGVAHAITQDLIGKFTGMFPFELTGAQKRVINEIAGDMQKDTPMLRLLQGDVGSGKTLVALFGCVAAFVNNRQAAIMVPTEILARQHFENIRNLMGARDTQIPRGLGNFRVSGSPGLRVPFRTALLVGNLPKKEKEKTLAEIQKGEIDLVVGTHALLNENVGFKNLSFVVIDEQHKFGVRQRALLSAKGMNPDILVMTATPIPRTLTITLFGDLDLSIIDEIPPGRGKVKTKLFSREQEQDAYAIVREQAQKGQQAYIIYPIIEESMKLDLKAAEAMFRRFQKHEFKGLKVGLVHGQMKQEEADKVMAKFKDRKIDVLVATTVLEVGIDVPNANVMVIEHAERFGLSQLHQLRGRIGRGKEDARCLLIADPTTEDGGQRLKAVLSTTDGFKIAEEDLLIRGPGHYFGRHQHGINELKFANPATQLDILELARKEAEELIHADPSLDQPADRVLKETIQKRYPGYLKMVEAG